MYYRPQWLFNIAIYIIIYMCIVAVFGPPYPSKNIVANSNHGMAAKESDVSERLYRLQSSISIVGLVITIVYLLLAPYGSYISRRANSDAKVKRSFQLNNLSIVLTAIIIIIFSALSLISYTSLRIAESESLQEFSRADLVLEAGIALLFISCLYGDVKKRKYFASKSVPRILAENYIRESQKYLDKQDHEKALMALVKACEAAPSEVLPWAQRASFVANYMSSEEEADKCFEKATENYKKNPNISDEDKAWYEFYFGYVLACKGQVEKARRHMKHSNEIIYDKNRAKCIEEWEEQLKSELL
jgi:tetratricopeptide (TPR) repeat protein